MTLNFYGNNDIFNGSKLNSINKNGQLFQVYTVNRNDFVNILCKSL